MDIKLTIVIAALLVLLLAVLRYKKNIALPLLVAFLVSMIWTTLYRYEYIGENIFLLQRINIYPLILWTCGLTGLYILQTHIVQRKNFFLLALAYFILLFAFEAIGYYLLNIRLANDFPSLWNMGIIHGPVVLKIFYIAAGPVYLKLLTTLAY